MFLTILIWIGCVIFGYILAGLIFTTSAFLIDKTLLEEAPKDEDWIPILAWPLLLTALIVKMPRFIATKAPGWRAARREKREAKQAEREVRKLLKGRR